MTVNLQQFTGYFARNIDYNNIILYHLFDDYKGKNFLYIVSNGDVYAMGANSTGSLGFNHNRNVGQPTRVDALCSRNICQLHNGL